MEKFTIRYAVNSKGNLERISQLDLEQSEFFEKISNTCPNVWNIIYATEMARLNVCEYTLIWYRTPKKARLTICKSRYE